MNCLTKAKRFGDELSITDFSYSNGWLQRFKQRHNISQHVLCGESAGVDPKLISDGKELAAAVINNFIKISEIDEHGLCNIHFCTGI